MSVSMRAATHGYPLDCAGSTSTRRIALECRPSHCQGCLVVQQASHSLPLQQVSRLLRAGGVVAYPTEAVWGLGCDPWQASAVERIWQIKGRDPGKGVIVIAADLAQIEPFLSRLTAQERALLASTWPGPVTWLVPADEGVPRWLRGRHDTLALRVSAHPGVQALCRAFGGPLVSTSANRAGQRPARTALQVRCWLGQEVDAIVPGQVGGLARPTEIRDLRSQRVVRAGDISTDQEPAP